MKGIYRRYDGKYVIVYDVVKDVDRLESLMLISFIGNEDKYVMKEGDFFSDEYETYVEENIVGKEKIINHPDNKFGQDKVFVKVEDMDNIFNNFSTENIVKVLRKRVDAPACLNDSVFCSDYVIGVPCLEYERGGISFPRGISIESICNSKEEAEKELIEYKVRGKDRMKMYKRVFVEVN